MSERKTNSIISDKIKSSYIQLENAGVADGIMSISTDGTLIPSSASMTVGSSTSRLVNTTDFNLGISVSLHGNTVAIGDPHFGGLGSVYIYNKVNNNWQFQTEVVSGDNASLDQYGYSVGLYKDTMVVGAPFKGGNFGAAYIFTRSNGVWTQQASISPLAPQAAQRFGTRVAIYGDTVVVSSYQEDIVGLDSGAVYVFTRSGVSWTQQARLISANPENNANFGTAMGIYMDTIAVGSFETVSAQANAGRVYVFSRSNNTWSLTATLTADTIGAGYKFGNSLGIYANTLAVSAPVETISGFTSAGAIYVFTSSGYVWSQQAKLVHPSLENNLKLGISNDNPVLDLTGLRVYGDLLIASANPSSINGVSNPGQVVVYTRKGSTWSVVKTLNATTPVTTGLFGNALSLYGNTICAGNESQRQVFIFDASMDAPQLTAKQVTANQVSADRTTTSYLQLENAGVANGIANISTNGAIIPSSVSMTVASSVSTVTGTNNAYGVDVSIYGNTAAVGDPTSITNGSVYIYNKVNNIWQYYTTVTATGGAINDQFGSAVSLYKDTLLVGAYNRSSAAGLAYVFTRTNGVWTQQSTLTPSTVEAGAQFGYQVALYENTAVVGAWGENVGGPDRGAVYVFTRSGSTWSQQAKLVSGNPEDNAGFGLSITVYMDTIAVGSFTETVSGNVDAGRVYIFTRINNTWSQTAVLTGNPVAANNSFGFALSLYSNTLAVAAPNETISGFTNAGAIYVFTSSGYTWTQQAKLVHPSLENDLIMGYADLEGRGVKLYGDMIIASAQPSLISGVSYPGQVVVYTRNNSSWSVLKILTAPTLAANAYFGASLALYGNTIIISENVLSNAYIFDASMDAPQLTAKQVTAAQIFSDKITTPYLQLETAGVANGIANISTDGAIIPSSVGMTVASSVSTFTSVNMSYGTDASIYGNTAAVGDYELSISNGSVYIYNKVNGIWQYYTTITATGGALNDRFGYAVSLYKNTLLVGAYARSSFTGLAYVFTRTNGVWTQQATLTPSTVEVGARFGINVSVYENTAVVGATTENVGGTDRGAVYVFTRSGSTWTQQAKLISGNPQDNANFGLSISIYMDTIAVGTDDTVNGFAIAGRVYIFTRINNTWSQTAVLTGNPVAANNQFGYALSLYSNTLAVASPYETISGFTQAGAIYVFTSNGYTWTQQAKLVHPSLENGLTLGSGFDTGRGLNLYGDMIISYANPSLISGVATPGQVVVYTRNNSSWSFLKTLNAPILTPGMAFGAALALYGNTLNITEFGIGKAHIFDASMDAPQLTAKQVTAAQIFSDKITTPYLQLETAGSANGIANINSSGNIIPSSVSMTVNSSLSTITKALTSKLGSSLCIYGNTVAMGDIDTLTTGAVYMYNKINGVWQFHVKLTPSDGAITDRFGYHVSLYNDTLLVGAPSKSGSAGSAYIFARSNGVWSEQAILVPSTIEVGAQFGDAVSLYENTAIVSAPYEDLGGTNRGAVYIFTRTNVTWTLQKKLISSVPENSARYGFATSIYMDTLAIGSKETVSGSVAAGRVYIFTRTNNIWTQTAALTAGTVGPSYIFGYALSLYSNTLAVASPYETISGFTQAGAIYVFTSNGYTWTQQAKLVHPSLEADLFLGLGKSSWGAMILYGDMLIASADPSTISGETYPGQVVVYTRNDTTWSVLGTINESPIAPLAQRDFGGAISLYGNTIGITNAIVASSGAAYMYDASLDVPKIYMKDIVVKNTNAELTIANSQTTSQTLNLPNITATDTVVANNVQATLTNKILSDSTVFVGDAADTTKRLGFDVNNSASTTLTLATAQTTNQTLNLPNITQTDTAIVSYLPQTEYKKVMIAGQDASLSTLYSSILTLSVGTNSSALVSNNGLFLYYMVTTTLYRYNVLTGATTSLVIGGTSNGIALSQLEKIYVANTSANTVVVVDANAMLVDTTISLAGAPAGTGPKNPVITPDEAYLYVPCNTSNSMKIIDLNTNLVVATVQDATTINAPDSIAILPAGTEVYIASNDRVAVYNIHPTNTLITSIATGTVTPFYIISDFTRSRMYCAQQTGNTVMVIDTTTRTVTSTINIAAVPKYLVQSRDGKYLFVTAGTSPGYLVVINLSTLAVITSITTNVPTNPVHITTSSDSKRVYISGDTEIRAFDVSTGRYIAYTFGQASQSNITLTGVNGAKWNRQMLGGIIVFADGTISDLSTYNDFDQITTTLSRTVAQQAYTIYYGSGITSPTGSGIMGANSVLMYPKISSSLDLSKYIQFQFESLPYTTVAARLIYSVDGFSGASDINIPNTGATNKTFAVYAGVPAIADSPTSVAIGGSSTTATDVGSVAVGVGATTGAIESTALGYQAIANSGGYSVAVGTNATCSGSDSVALGGYANTGTSAANVAIGTNSSTSSFTQAVAVGRFAFARTNSVSVGFSASVGNTSSIAIGSSTNTTLSGTGCIAIGSSSSIAGSGTNNIILGTSSTIPSSTNASNIIIGCSSTVTSARNNVTCIGNNILAADASLSDAIYFNKTAVNNTAGVASAASFNTATGRLFAVASSIRYKQNVQDLDNTEVVLTLRPRKYNFKPTHCGCSEVDCDGNCVQEVGLIAEEVSALTDGRYIAWGIDPETGNRREESVQYDRLVVPLITEVKKLKDTVDVQQLLISQMNDLITAQQTQLTAQQTQINQLLTDVAALKA